MVAATTFSHEPVLQVPLSTFYSAKCVLVTGATGFLGKFLIEKLLFATPVETIFVLLRSKKGKCPSERLQQFKEDPLFKFRLSSKHLQRIKAIPGDISLPGLDLDDHHRSLITSNVHIIFHSAASVRFDDPLPQAVTMNVSATLEVLKLAKECCQLESFVHVSTAFVNCFLGRLDEGPVECSLDPHQVLDDVNCVKTLAPYPNTYTLTKSLAEKLVAQFASNSNLPLAIARPSIILSSHKEPVAGYCDSFTQAAAALVSIRGAGLLRVIPADGDKQMPIIPVDICANGLIIVAAACHSDFTIGKTSGRIFALTNSTENQITFAGAFNGTRSQQLVIDYAFKYAVRQPREFDFCPNEKVFSVKSAIYDWTFALLCDLLLLLSLKQPRITRVVKRALRQMRALRFFMTRSYDVANGNLLKTWSSLSPCDQVTFNFDCKQINWHKFNQHYWLGLRKYTFNQKEDEEEEARKHLRRVTYVSWGINLFNVIFIPALIAFVIWGVTSLLTY